MRDISYSKRYNIERLQKWLNYELSSSVLMILYLFSHLAIFIMGIAAILFIPLLLSVLFAERKYGWILFFIIFVAGPAVFILTLDIAPGYMFILQALSVALFYFYCFILKMVISDW